MLGFASYQWLFYGGIAAMVLAGILFFVQLILFFVNKSRLERKMDEEYGQPQMYNRKEG